jgi:sporulation protein YlmC with PRC-barrel domain
MAMRKSQLATGDTNGIVVDTGDDSGVETDHRPHIMAADTLPGEVVRNDDGDPLGEVAHVMMDFETGQVAYAVLSVGGFLGIGEKLIAVPWSALHQDPDAEGFRLSVTIQQLDEAKALDQDDWSEMANRRWAEDLHDFYGAEPYWLR